MRSFSSHLVKNIKSNQKEGRGGGWGLLPFHLCHTVMLEFLYLSLVLGNFFFFFAVSGLDKGCFSLTVIL